MKHLNRRKSFRNFVLFILFLMLCLVQSVTRIPVKKISDLEEIVFDYRKVESIGASVSVKVAQKIVIKPVQMDELFGEKLLVLTEKKELNGLEFNFFIETVYTRFWDFR